MTKKKLLISQSEQLKHSEPQTKPKPFGSTDTPSHIERTESSISKRPQRQDSIRQLSSESSHHPATIEQSRNSKMATDEDRLSSIYSGFAGDTDTTAVKRPVTFGNIFQGFMARSNRDLGQVNPAFAPDDDDVTDDDTDARYCNSDSESSRSRSYSDSSYRSSSSRSPSPTEAIPNGHVVNRGRDFKINHASVKVKNTPPPQQDKQKEKKPWDRFTTASKDNFSTQDKAFWDNVFKKTKIVVAILLFLFTLGTAVISKICFVIIAANMLVPDDTSANPLKTFNWALDYSNTKHLGQTNVQWIWAMVSLIGAPYLFTVCRNIWKIWVQLAIRGSPSWSTLFLVLLVETVHSIGLLVTVLVVVPNMDPISGLLFPLCIGVIPGVLNVVYPATRKEDLNGPGRSKTRYYLGNVVNVIGALGQIAAIGVWCYHIYTIYDKFDRISYLACVILAPIFTSIHWWENYVHEGKKVSSGLPLLARYTRKSRTKLTFYSNLWKMILTIIIPMALYGSSCKDGAGCIDTLYLKRDSAKLGTAIIDTSLIDAKDFGQCSSYLPIIVAAIGAICSVVSFKLGKMGCKIMTQIVDYSLPLVLSTPVTVGVIFGMYAGFITADDTGCHIPFPRWTSDDSSTYFQMYTASYKSWLHVIAGMVGFVSLLLVTNHIWYPGKERLQRTDKLFVQPLYCGVMTDLSLMLNRRRIETANVSDTVKTKVKEQRVYEDEDVNLQEKSVFTTQDTPIIYMCATMWHEDEDEMTQLLKSVFRMDEDQCTRKNAQYLVNRRDPDYYEFEAHIFFDDAFEKHKEGQYDFTVNEYVKLLIKTVQFSGSAIIGTNYKIKPPIKMGTPYGGRLIWTLPGGNKLIAHLKDKAVIRHRKRWSQVMYMYYFLAYQLFKGEDKDTKVDKKKEKILRKRARNTFLLALDGDVDFYPNAVQLLVDRMKKNPDVGAACGRIHPIGNGAMVWYQKFEYAISHWLQKAAEDKLGCVLCSPGCFSLFRGSALMDENVMNKYTTPPTTPRHHVQYDQGEDRWLCTLLLQQGHRVEYCAASDALTKAPEGFYEFFKQRRRWMPSTMANIMDLLTDWKNVTEKNSEISLLYVFYQGLLMVSSILTPGTIFLMILGAISMAYSSINLWIALIVNVLPVAIMIIMCFVATDEKQLTYAAILSTAYSLIMMIVIVGLLVQAAKFGICSITTVFITFVGGVFVLSALIHPQEFWCIIHGFLYFLSIPSMSMILMIYSLGNLHIVTWGTRENKTAEVLEQKKEKKEKLPGCLRVFERFLPSTHHQSDDDKLRAILRRLEGIEDQMIRMSEAGSRFSDKASLINRPSSASSISPFVTGEGNNEKFSQIKQFLSGAGERENPLYEPDKPEPRDMLVDPYWMKDDPDLLSNKEATLDDDEVQFWKELIEEYLKPLDANPEKQKVMQAELIELRNKVCLIFILINSLFVIIVFTLQQVVASDGSLSILLPCGDPDADRETRAGQSIEPISVAFTLVFGILLFVQFICMLQHRMATLLHICASTEIFAEKRKVRLPGQEETGEEEEDTRQALSYEEVYEMVRDLQKDQDVDSVSVASEASYVMSEVDDEEYDNKKKEEDKARWKRIARARTKVTHNTLHVNFMKNVETLQRVVSSKGPGENNEEEDEEVTAKRIKKEAKFNRFRSQSLHVLAHISKDKSMREQLARKKTQRGRKNFQVVAKKALGMKKISQLVEVAKAAKERDEIRQQIQSEEIEMEKRLTYPAPEDDTDGIEFTGENGRAKETVVKSVHSDGSTGQEKAQDNSSNSRSLSEDEFQIHIPKVEEDQWPEEEEYVNNEQKVDLPPYGDGEKFDTFF